MWTVREELQLLSVAQGVTDTVTAHGESKQHDRLDRDQVRQRSFHQLQLELLRGPWPLAAVRIPSRRKVESRYVL